MVQTCFSIVISINITISIIIGVWRLVLFAWCLMIGIVFGVWSLVLVFSVGVWCLVFGVWCLVFGVWCWC